MMHVPADDRSAVSSVDAASVARHWRLRVDISERQAALLDLARGCGDFEICMERLAVGDYLIEVGSSSNERRTLILRLRWWMDDFFPKRQRSRAVLTGRSFSSKGRHLRKCLTFTPTR